MPDLVQTTSPASPAATPLTDAQTGALTRACLSLLARWRVTDTEAATLLGVTPETLTQWKIGHLRHLRHEQATRLSGLIGIHKALRTIFPNSELAYGWVRRPNTAFGTHSALEVMLRGELADIMHVWDYLATELEC